MALTAYTDVITLDQAKLYLRIDDTQSATDAEITQMIKSALRYIEKQTNHIMWEREMTYNVDNCINIYDHPIQSVTSPTSYERTDKSTYSRFEMNDGVLTLQVGYDDFNDIPTELVDFALIYVAAMYFGQENNEKVVIPLFALDMLDSHRRFIL